jgi:hypothetical protein
MGCIFGKENDENSVGLELKTYEAAEAAKLITGSLTSRVEISMSALGLSKSNPFVVMSTWICGTNDMGKNTMMWKEHDRTEPVAYNLNPTW